MAALGIVYGDIGTSPIYALRECFHGSHPFPPTPDNVLGVLSLIFWALMITISIKYLLFVMSADNHGEGGILALLALLAPWRDRSRKSRVLLFIGLFGAALLYGDGAITPAISVLSAVEGLEIAAPGLKPYVLPITIAVLVLLFRFQKRGSSRIGTVFGPVMLLWFATLPILGISWIVRAPQVLTAVNPAHGADFFIHNGWHGFVVLGAVFLVVTGGEALYADMGHFGRFPIRLAWFALVLPALLLNYFGQAALILLNPGQARQPFFNLAPGWALYPLVVLATLATVIASQAVISGAFSLTRQAVQLGQFPHVHIIQTSREEIGQIYIPSVNWLLMIVTISLVLGFGSSSKLAGAYGVAVTTTMVITVVLAFFVAVGTWRWHPVAAALITTLFLTVDLSFFGANMLKIGAGGWFPLAAGGIVFAMMATWHRGREILAQRLQETREPLDHFLLRIAANPPLRVPGTAVFMVKRVPGAPPQLLHHLAHNHVLHEQVVLLTVVTREVPRVTAEKRLEVIRLEQGFSQVTVNYGFMQSPNVPVALRECELFGLKVNLDTTTYFLAHETLIPSLKRRGMMLWREKLFSFMTRNALPSTDFFRIPPERVVELGIRLEI
ncbi:potassium transporter Kup [Geobacter grbiciae]|uniref:potassium transporter Kup n=1 Tax=Geobacter grbiciae TaxID=155042 RepID=UPI001FE46B9D|nr:potassium transporter Kup [Geobacter grbiciae]